MATEAEVEAEVVDGVDDRIKDSELFGCFSQAVRILLSRVDFVIWGWMWIGCFSFLDGENRSDDTDHSLSFVVVE